MTTPIESREVHAEVHADVHALPVHDATRLSRRELFALLAAGGFAALVPGASHAQGVPNAKRGGILRISGQTNPSSMDPYTGGAGTDHTFLWPVFDTLVEWEAQFGGVDASPGEVVPS